MSVLNTAIALTQELGWSVLPLNYIDGEQCSCGHPDCSAPAKHPLTKHGVIDATNKKPIVQWWFGHKWDRANLGVATGNVSGIVVIDIDFKSGGLQSFCALTKKNPIRETVKAKSGNGFHLYFTYPDGGSMRNKVGLAPGIDCRADNGYVVAPPSYHWSGVNYRWIVSPFQRELAPLPDWLLDLVLTRAEAEASANEYVELIPEGHRNAAMAYFAGVMRRRGMTAEAIKAALLVENRLKCSPPLPEYEVIQTAESIGRRAPDEAGLGWVF